MTETLVIGVGNPCRKDDGAGILAARKLAAKRLPGVRVMERNGEGTSLIAAWEGFSSILVLDAVSSGAKPGTIHRIKVGPEDLPAGFDHHSSHSFGVAEAVELARTLGRLPSTLVIYGIEGEDYSPGEGLSSNVERAAGELADRLAKEFQASI